MPKFWWVVVTIAAVAVGGVITFGGKKTGEDRPAPITQHTGTMKLGNPNAPITVVEYSDFQCPFCAIFARDTLPQLIDEFVATGQMHFQLRNFPVFGEFSTLSAHGSMCALEQGAFWPFHDALFEQVGSL